MDGDRCARRWGNGAFPNACGVLVPGSTDSIGFNGSSALCAANVQRVQEFTIGFWQDIYKGDLGRAGSVCNMNT